MSRRWSAWECMPFGSTKCSLLSDYEATMNMNQQNHFFLSLVAGQSTSAENASLENVDKNSQRDSTYVWVERQDPGPVSCGGELCSSTDDCKAIYDCLFFRPADPDQAYSAGHLLWVEGLNRCLDQPYNGTKLSCPLVSKRELYTEDCSLPKYSLSKDNWNAFDTDCNLEIATIGGLDLAGYWWPGLSRIDAPTYSEKLSLQTLNIGFQCTLKVPCNYALNCNDAGPLLFLGYPIPTLSLHGHILHFRR